MLHLGAGRHQPCKLAHKSECAASAALLKPKNAPIQRRSLFSIKMVDKRNESLGQAGSTEKVAFAAADPFLHVFSLQEVGVQNGSSVKAALQGQSNAASPQQGPRNVRLDCQKQLVTCFGNVSQYDHHHQ